MYEFLLWLAAFFAPAPAPVTYAEPAKKDYIGLVAAEAAYSSLLPSAPDVKPLVDTKDCKRCNGRGQIPTGDSNHPWTDCPDCESKTASAGPAGGVQISKPTRLPMQMK